MELESEKIKILVAIGNEFVRMGLSSSLKGNSSLRIVAETDRFVNTLQLTFQHTPDVLLLDLQLKDGDCLEKVSKLLSLSPTLKILLFTSNTDVETHVCALHLGVSGVFNNDQSTDLLFKAIHTISESDQLWFDRNIAQRVLRQTPHISTPKKSLVDTLRARERGIACMSAKGLSAKKIASTLFISEKTVRNQLTIVYEKLGLHGQVELCLQYKQESFCSSSPSACFRGDRCPSFLRSKAPSNQDNEHNEHIVRLAI
jgi:DNA-binding NarL/FixJ family response regulator